VIPQAQNIIRIWNNGDGIPVEIHKEEKVYVPELIFGHLLTSSNYDDNEKKVTIPRADVCGAEPGVHRELTRVLTALAAATSATEVVDCSSMFNQSPVHDSPATAAPQYCQTTARSNMNQACSCCVALL
jgi:DNA gyrase/topoisomerase IV subunit B